MPPKSAASKMMKKKKMVKKAVKASGSMGFKAVQVPFSTQSAVVPLASKSVGTNVVYY